MTPSQSTDDLVKRLEAAKGHTPGPWVISRDDREGMEWNLHIVSAPDPNLTICFMAHDGDGKNEHGEANAALIALAPEMKDTIERLQRERDEYKIWWERDSTSLGKVLADRDMQRTCKEDFRAQAATLRCELEAMREDVERRNIRLTGYQIKHIWDFIDSENDADITIGYGPEFTDEDGFTPAGLRAWFTEYPEEGAIHLYETPEEHQTAINAARSEGGGP